MGRQRSRRDGRFEEENNSSSHRLGELLEFGEEMKRKEAEEAAAAQALEYAKTAPIREGMNVRRAERRAAITLTLTIATIEAIDRLSIVRGIRRGYVIDDIIMAAAKAELKPAG